MPAGSRHYGGRQQHPVTLPKLTCPRPVLGDNEALTVQLGVANGSGFLGTVNGQQAAQVAVGGPALVAFSFHRSETLQGDVVWGQKEGAKLKETQILLFGSAAEHRTVNPPQM